MKILSAALILSIIIAPLPASATSVDFAIKTVMAWKLAAGKCNKTLNLKGRECTRLDSIDATLTAHGCTVTMAMWWCPIPPGKTCSRFGEKGEPLNCHPILPEKRSP